MEPDQVLDQIGEQLSIWYVNAVYTADSMDEATRESERRYGMALIDQAKRVKAENLTALRIALNQQASMPDEERVETLVRVFVSAAKLKGALGDALKDTDGCSDAVTITNSVAETLDRIGSGRGPALGPLLDHPDPRVRASAGAYLVGQMPDRVLPVLEEVRQSVRGTSAGLTAFFTIRDWELERNR